MSQNINDDDDHHSVEDLCSLASSSDSSLEEDSFPDTNTDDTVPSKQ